MSYDPTEDIKDKECLANCGNLITDDKEYCSERCLKDDNE